MARNSSKTTDDELDRHLRGALPREFSLFGRRKDLQLAPVVGIAPGRVIDDYQLIRVIGQGGMGQVWEAEQLSLERKVALKLVRPDRVSEHTLDLFSREARAGGRLSHPGIVSLIAHGEADGVAWISMELVEGAWTLKDFIAETTRTGELPGGYYEAVAQLMVEVADGLQAAHAVNVIHRDLKPGNVLITPDEHPKVTDFGLAKITDETALSLTGDIAGTYAYMSPEQVAAKRAGLDHRTDVFSLGVVLYEMLTLRRPFEGDTSAQVAQQILMKDPPDPVSVRSRIPGDLAVICGKCLEKDVDRRYQSMADLAADIRRHLGHEPIHAKPPTAWQRAAKWVKRNPTRSSVGTVAALALVAIAALWLRAEGNLERALEAEGVAAVERDRALVAEQAATTERERVLHLAYSGNLQAAQAAHGNGRTREAREHLEACPAELRDWEWYHLDLSLDQSLSTLEGHTGDVFSAIWDPAGIRILSHAEDATLRIWDAATRTCLQVLEGHTADISSAAWNPEGTQVVSGSEDNTLRIWDAATGTSLHTLEGHANEVTCVAWNSAGTRIVSGSVDTTLRLWDVATGTSLHTLAGHADEVNSVAWNPDGPSIVSGSDDSTLRIWDGVTGASIQLLVGHTSSVDLVAWNPHGTRIVSCGWDETIRIWDASEHTSLLTLEWPRCWEPCVAWNPQGTQIVSGSFDSTLSIWDAVTGAKLLTMKGHDGCVSSVAWNAQGTRVLSGSDDGTLRTWDAATGESIQTLEGHLDGVASVALNPQGTKIVSASADDSLRIWDVATGSSMQTLKEHGDYRFSLGGILREPQEVEPRVLRDLMYESTDGFAAAWNPQGTRIVSGSGDSTMRLWDSISGASLGTLEGHRSSVPTVDWNAEGTRIVSASTDNTLRIWDAATGDPLRTLEGHTDEVYSAAWNAQGTRIVSGSADHTIRIWDAETGTQIGVLEGHTGEVFLVAWDPQGSQIVSGSRDETLRVWDVATGTTVRTMQADDLSAAAVGWFARGTRIVSGSWGSTLHIWDVETGTLLRTLEGQADSVSCVGWNLQGTRIASGSSDGTVRIWDPVTGTSLRTLEAGGGTVFSVAWNMQGTRLLSTSGDEMLRIWESRIDEALPLWHTLDLRRQVRNRVEALFRELVVMESVIAALRVEPALSDELRKIAIRLAEARGDLSTSELNRIAWNLVHPDRADQETDVALGLRVARAAVELGPSNYPLTRETLGWALLANGLYDEAIVASEQAFDLMWYDDLSTYQATIDRLQRMIEEARSSQGPISDGDSDDR